MNGTGHAGDSADERAVRNTVMLYFAGLDRRDAALFEDVFVEDARMTALNGEREFSGRDEIVASLMKVRNFPMSSHHPTSQVMEIDDARASVDTYALAYLVTNDGRIIVRGIRYLDEFVRTGSQWRIRFRRHIPQWQFEVGATEVSLPGLNDA